jgi:hypothetical protein
MMVISAASAVPAQPSTPAIAATATLARNPVLNPMATSLFFGHCAQAYTM